MLAFDSKCTLLENWLFDSQTNLIRGVADLDGDGIDEIDKMKKSDQATLLNVMETGIFPEILDRSIKYRNLG